MYLCEKLNNMPQTFEQMQFSHELSQGQDFDSTDHSKVDHLRPNDDCDDDYTPSHPEPDTYDDAELNFND